MGNLCPHRHLYPIAAQGLVHDGCRLRVLARQEVGIGLEERHLRPETLQGLRQLTANGAATDHTEPLRTLGQGKNALVGQITALG